MAKTTTGTTTRPAGIIEFGSDDESVVYQHAMTSTPTDNGAEFGTGVSFDSNGLNTNGTGGWQFDMTSLDPNDNLGKCGQISVDVLSSAIGTIKSWSSGNHTGSNGVAPDTANDVLISWCQTNAAGSIEGRIQESSENELWVTNDIVSLSGGAVRLTDQGKGTYCTLTYAWQGPMLSLYVDGVPFGKTIGTAKCPSDLFNYICVGSYSVRTTADQITSADKYIKNLIISNRPVMLAGHPMLRKPVVMGDSFGVAHSEAVATSNRFDHSPSYQMKGYLASKGLRCGSPSTTFPSAFDNESVNGTVVDDAPGGTPISDTTAAVLAHKPSIVIFHGGTNDAGRASGFVRSTFQTELQSIMSALLASTTTVQKVFIPTIPSLRGDDDNYSANAIAATTDINQVINDLPAWWDAANPSDTGRIVVYDVWTALGEDTGQLNKNIIGLWSTTHSSYGNDLHPSSQGGRITGRLLGAAIYENL